MDTLAAIAAILAPFGTVRIQSKILGFGPGNAAPQGVAMLNPSGQVVLLPRDGFPARNVGKGESAEDVAREIMQRLGLLAARAA